MTSSLLEQLVEYRGIESHYNDAWGRPTTIDSSTKTKLLSAMGYHVNDPDLLLKQVEGNNTKTWLSVLNPVRGKGRLPIRNFGDFLIFLEHQN